MFRLFALLLLASPAFADDRIDRLVAATQAAFPRAPGVEIVADIGAVCGGGADGAGVFCTSQNRIYLSRAALSGADMPYVLAHLYGHGLQVRYGVADVALAAIRADRGREAELRGMVTRQVECLAGMLLARSGNARPGLSALYGAEPFTGSHWGRQPVRTGPRVSIGIAARQEWLARGHAAAAPGVCSVGEMSAELIVAADQS